MNRRLAARSILAAAGLMPAMAWATCLAIAAHPDGRALDTIDAATFDIRYVHSVTRTPVVERYRIDGAILRETSIAFREHGPGLPTEADPGQSFERTAEGFVVTTDRAFDTIVMRVHAEQSPRLEAAGGAVDLSRWGNRAIALRAAPCAPH